jgi:hypothetical protein
MSNAASAAAWCQSDWLLVAIVPAALMAGRLLVRGVDGLSEPRPRAAGRPPLIEVATAVAAAAIWWWEVRGLGQLSATPASADLFVVCLRYLAHLFFFFLLAAAAWVDLRDRVIPDSITVPGVVLGLAWNATLPQTLLPIEHAVERSFAPPTMEPDVLGAFGPLEHLGLPGWLIGSAGLAATLALFAVWWWFGLPPAGTAGEAEASHPDARVARLRLPIGCVGAAGLVAARLSGHGRGRRHDLGHAGGCFAGAGSRGDGVRGRHADGDGRQLARLAGLCLGLRARRVHRLGPWDHATGAALRIGASLRPEPLPRTRDRGARLATALGGGCPAVRAADRDGRRGNARDRPDRRHPLGLVPPAEPQLLRRAAGTVAYDGEL